MGLELAAGNNEHPVQRSFHLSSEKLLRVRFPCERARTEDEVLYAHTGRNVRAKGLKRRTKGVDTFSPTKISLAPLPYWECGDVAAFRTFRSRSFDFRSLQLELLSPAPRRALPIGIISSSSS